MQFFHTGELFLSEDSQALSHASSRNLISAILKLKVTPPRAFTLCSCPGAPRHGPLKPEIGVSVGAREVGGKREFMLFRVFVYAPLRVQGVDEVVR